MIRFTMQFAGAAKLLTFLVLSQVSVAIILTEVANKTNRSHLAYLVVLSWVVLSCAAVLFYRKRLVGTIRLFIVAVAWLVSLVVYTLVGYFLLGWTGLIKGLNG
jgi:hypothetical protein